MTDTDERYLNRVKKALKRSGDHKLEYYSGFVKEVEGFIEENSQADMDTLEQYFGSPDAVANDFLDTLPDDEIQQKIILRDRLMRFTRVVIIIIAAILVFLAGFFVYDTWSFNHGETAYGIASEEPPILANDEYRTY